MATPPAPPAAAPTPAAPAPRLREGRTPWWIVPLVIVVIVVIAWLLMAGLPFGREERPRVAERPAAETIGEAPAPVAPPQSSGTIVDVAADTAEPPPVIVPDTTPEPTTTTTVTTTTVAPPPPPVAVPRRELTEAQAENVLRGYVTSRRYYDGVRPECVQLRGSGYRNAGYGFSVWDSCADGGGSRMLGRWRVDAKTQEVFVQRDDGRYLRP